MKRNTKGFTIVELVIVIAIIAILAAVLIPVFSNIVNKANVSADYQVIRNMNTALAAESKPATMHEALAIVKAYGYDVGLINAKGKDAEILYDSVNNVFCYFDGESKDIKYIPDTTLTNEYVKEYQYWEIIDANAETVTDEENKLHSKIADKKWSLYVRNAGNYGSFVVSTGVDVGDCDNIESLTYANAETAQNVVIRTNTFGTKLTVNGYVDPADKTKGDVVTHYGFAGLVDVRKCALASYDEYGTIGRITANSTDAVAHIDIKDGATVYQVVENEGEDSFVTVDANATVYKADGTKIEGAVDSRSAATDTADMFIDDAPASCAHTNTHIFSDGQYMYEVCDTCGYTVITVIDSTTGTVKKDVVDADGNEKIVPISTYTTDNDKVKIDAQGKVVIAEDAEPTVPTPVVDKDQPITNCEHKFEYTQVDENTHKVTCTKCGIFYNEVHSFGENNTCEKCEYENATTPYLVTWLNSFTNTIPELEENVDLSSVTQADLAKGGVTNAKIYNGDLYIVVPGRQLYIWSWGDNKFTNGDVYIGFEFDSTIDYSGNYPDSYSIYVAAMCEGGETHFGCYTKDGNSPTSFDEHGSTK